MTGFVIFLTIMVLLGFWLIMREVSEAHKRLDRIEECLLELAKELDGERHRKFTREIEEAYLGPVTKLHREPGQFKSLDEE